MDWITIVLNLYPVATLFPILIALLSITFILLLSFRCTYLKRRYCGYSLDNRVVSKYVVWWCVQAMLLFLCATPYTQILLAVIFPIMLLINWTLLVAGSRRLSRAIRSVLYEIKHFECDDVSIELPIQAIRLIGYSSLYRCLLYWLLLLLFQSRI